MSSRERAPALRGRLVSVLVLGTATAGCTGVPSNALVGTWELVSFAYTTGDSTTRGDTTQMRSLKILNSTHFAWLTIAPGGARFVGAGSGRYQVHDSTYTEASQYASQADHVGQTYQFRFRVEDDRWYHTGMVNGVLIEETWRRIR